MPNTYFGSDLHDGHKVIGKYRTPIIPEIVDPKTNREFIADNWRATSKHDVTILFGDVFFAPDSHTFIGSLAGHKKLYLGNHDLQSRGSTLAQIMSVCDTVDAVETRKYFGEKYWCSHCPMHPTELRGKKNIHGHIHNLYQDYMNIGTDNYDERYINVNMDVVYPRTGKIILSLDELDDYRQGFPVEMVFVVIEYKQYPTGYVYTNADYFEDQTTANYAMSLTDAATKVIRVQKDAATALLTSLDKLPIGCTIAQSNEVYKKWIEENSKEV